MYLFQNKNERYVVTCCVCVCFSLCACVCARVCTCVCTCVWVCGCVGVRCVHLSLYRSLSLSLSHTHTLSLLSLFPLGGALSLFSLAISPGLSCALYSLSFSPSLRLVWIIFCVSFVFFQSVYNAAARGCTTNVPATQGSSK